MSKKKKKTKTIEIVLTDEELAAMFAAGEPPDGLPDEWVFMEERQPQVAWKWGKWTFGFWTDPGNRTRFGIDIGPLEICWRNPGYRQ